MISDFVELVIKKRKERGISQEKLAQILDTSTVTISFIENGKAEMDVDMCKKAADYFDIPYSEIFKGTADIKETAEHKKKRTYAVLAKVIVALFVANILLGIGLKLYDVYQTPKSIVATVLEIDDDVITVKNRANYGILTHDTYRIRLNDELREMCQGIETWDVVNVYYYFTLVDWCDNPSWSVRKIKKNEYTTRMEAPYYKWDD